MKRRQFLTVGLQSVTLLSTLSYSLTTQAGTSLTVSQQATFIAFVDTLIPEDQTPSASGLGLDKKLIVHAQTVHNYLSLITLGCQWLDQQAQAKARVTFSRLTDEHRQHVVSLAEMSASGSIAKQLFDHVRADLFEFYYSHPTVWTSLNLHGAPQPYGYLDYTQAPKKTAL